MHTNEFVKCEDGVHTCVRMCAGISTSNVYTRACTNARTYERRSKHHNKGLFIGVSLEKCPKGRKSIRGCSVQYPYIRANPRGQEF